MDSGVSSGPHYPPCPLPLALSEGSTPSLGVRCSEVDEKVFRDGTFSP